ncbi:hypothetical protein ACFQL0_10880 [Haloplanus litoreus]|uniref:hypothetical protein n=1 Tax=Haloplanus litoreus TaxID=767515 RepID=UPI00360F3FEB
MTGLLDGLRSWLGSFFGTGDASDDASEDRTSERTAAAPSTVEGTVPTVVHRDDRPLETPADLEPSPPADADRSHPGDGTERDERGRVEIPDAEDGADAGSAPDGVSIPDAESGAETSPESVAGDARPDRADRVAVADAEPPTGTEAAEGGGDAAGVEDADDARTGGSRVRCAGRRSTTRTKAAHSVGRRTCDPRPRPRTTARSGRHRAGRWCRSQTRTTRRWTVSATSARTSETHPQGFSPPTTHPRA